MKQIIQNFKTGKVSLQEVPSPMPQDGFVLVRNAFSLVSPGTEKATIETGRLSILGKAKRRPDLVRQVLQNIRKEGILATLQKAEAKLDSPKLLGYSCAGTVIESKDFGSDFKPGDRVACAGQDYASHAEIVCCPAHLVVKIPENISFEEAAFTTLGAIALQGVRQAEPQIGEKVCVIGLGLIGQITAQLLKANGCSVFGIDIDDSAVTLGRTTGIHAAANRRDDSLMRSIASFTCGQGFDKVIIAASSVDNEPVVLATEILRKKGKMVVVGNVRMDIPREPDFYRKELELRISTSYGPGRYDPLYEEGGVDYPFAYVRFTEQRNMEAFLELLSRGALAIKPLITHVFDFHDSLEAYEAILGRREHSVGVLLRYARNDNAPARKVTLGPTGKLGEVRIGFIGAGSFSRGYLFPVLQGAGVTLHTVVTARGPSARNAAERSGFAYASTDAGDIITNPEINAVFIATRHDTHADYVCQALQSGKHVFVEKPLALSVEELRRIVSVYTGEQLLMVGFNRRFSALTESLRRSIGNPHPPLVMHYRINAGEVVPGHWVQDALIGGGRVIGEVCHFIDLMSCVAGADPGSVFAASVRGERAPDNLAVTVTFSDGSVGNILYTAMGDGSMEKERFECFAGGAAFVIRDFKEGFVHARSRVKRLPGRGRGKGHREEVKAFLSAVKTGGRSPIAFESLLHTTLATFKIQESLASGTPLKIDIRELY